MRSDVIEMERNDRRGLADGFEVRTAQAEGRKGTPGRNSMCSEAARKAYLLGTKNSRSLRKEVPLAGSPQGGTGEAVGPEWVVRSLGFVLEAEEGHR